jgi:hypothetical protein
MARVIDQVLGATTSSVVGEITRELVNASDGAGLHFADGGKIELANSAAAEFGTADFSIEFVLNQTGDNTSDNYIYTSHTPGNNRLYIWNDISANKVNLEFVDGSASASTKVLDYDMSADYGTVTHYVITCDRSGNATLYKNGNSVATVDISSTSSIDIGAGNTNVGALSAGAGYGVLGTFYRFRTWNKSLSSAEVQTAYERADVPVADQYGSQTEKVANSGLENWNVANTVPDDWPTFTAGSSAIARSSDAASGSYSAQLSVDSSNNNVYINTSAVTLPAGKTIRYSVQMKGSTAIDKVSIYALGDNVMIAEPALTTSYQTFTGTYTATADSRLLIGRNSGGNGASKSIFVDNASVVQIGCVSDYDLAFANPTQSRTVQDRSGAADGTASTSGVTQVQPVVQFNAERLLVNGTVPRVGIGLPVADTPGGLLSIDATNSNTPKILFENQAGETADAAITTIDDTGGTDICIGSNVYINSAGYLTRFNAAEESSYIYAAKTGNVYLGTGDTSATASNRLQITKSGDILINAPGFNANVGAKKMQFEGSASTAVGPEMLLHNPAQGGGAASMLTFGGKASGTEGYTAAIKATNTGTLTIGTSSASGGFSEPAADLTIDSTGLTTAKDLLVADGSNDVAVALGNSGYGMALDFSSGELSLKTNTVPRLTVSNLGLATFSGDTKIGDGLVSNYVKHVAGLDDTVAISFTFPSQGTRWINHLIELRVAMGDDSTTTAFPTFLRYAIASLTSINGITQMDASLGSGITVGTSSSGTTFTVTLTEGSAISMDSVTVFATATAGHGDAKCTGMTVA